MKEREEEERKGVGGRGRGRGRKGSGERRKSRKEWLILHRRGKMRWPRPNILLKMLGWPGPALFLRH